MSHKRLRKQLKSQPGTRRWLKFHKSKTKAMYREIPEMTEQQRFDQYRTELECVIEIAALHRDEFSQRACNRLAEHVRQQAKISASAEHAIILLEQQAKDIRSLKAKYQTAFNALRDITMVLPVRAVDVARGAMQACIDLE